jgi:hypothetical protein
VTFRYRADPVVDAPLHYGLIAEDVQRVFPDLVLRDRDGKISGVRYEELSSMLLNELQREHATLLRLEEANADFAERLAALERRSAHEPPVEVVATSTAPAEMPPR